ncbi:hypothetical protein NPIL_233681 [Nephila pilipes]|uniref:Uncharacterized protein n=1 Tax=Nephila pilipes TaxID=299642 RepID=A0A8X6PQI1_NEPPI|nr:hypothetical protein NPIL_233681 [Nephila pilipes]
MNKSSVCNTIFDLPPYQYSECYGNTRLCGIRYHECIQRACITCSPRVAECLAHNASSPANSIIYHPTNNGLEHANRSTPFGTQKGR